MAVCPSFLYPPIPLLMNPIPPICPASAAGEAGGTEVEQQNRLIRWVKEHSDSL